jgi:glycosyltransferase involved in cell wall biosynthesis
MKIALCMPIHSGAKPRFVECLSRLLVKTANGHFVEDGQTASPVIESFVYSTSGIAFARRKLVDLATEWGADWLFWLDADHTFPPDALLQLLARQKPVVGANYRRRNAAHEAPTAAGYKDGKFFPVMPGGDGIDEVMSLGMGLCLTHADVFRRIEKPYFYDEMRPDGQMIGEDVTFCRKVRAAGIGVFVDHALSRQVGHITDVDLRFSG